MTIEVRNKLHWSHDRCGVAKGILAEPPLVRIHDDRLPREAQAVQVNGQWYRLAGPSEMAWLDDKWRDAAK